MAEVEEAIELVRSSSRVVPIAPSGPSDHNLHETCINLQQDMPKSLGDSQALDAWLPITQSRKGSVFTATCHLLCSGIGIQALTFPLAFIYLGWFWGTLCLSLVFVWQLYTTWLLVHLHQPLPGGTRYSRFVVLSMVAFGPKLGKILAIFPTMYLSGGTCVLFIIKGGEIMELLYQILCRNDPKCFASAFTGAEWFLIFICSAILISLVFPTLNSLTGVSLLGSVAVVLYTTLLWSLSVSKGRPDGVSYKPSEVTSEMRKIPGTMKAIGIIALSFRGHNVMLEIQGTFVIVLTLVSVRNEIQGTLPSKERRPSSRCVWKAVMAAYLVIPACLYPLAIVGYWAYGKTRKTMMHTGVDDGGILTAFSESHTKNISMSMMAAIHIAILLHYLSAFQIYVMPVYDNLERLLYVGRKKEPCPKWVRSAIRVFFGGFAYLISVACPFLGSLGPLLGAMTLPLTLAYPCFMWIALKKPRPMSLAWCFNTGLASLGVFLSSLLAAAAVWNLVAEGLEANFFRPR